MKKLGWIAILITTLTLGTAFAGNLNQVPSSDVLVSAFGARTDTTITNLIAAVGTRHCNFVFDGGPWLISTNNVTFSSTIGVTVTAGAYFDVTNGAVMTFNGGGFNCGNQVAFSGTGSATGTAYFIYRWPAWGDTGRFVIGQGVYAGVSPALDGTTLTLTGDEHVRDVWMRNGYATDMTISNTLSANNGYFNNITVSNTATFKGPTTVDSAASWWQNDLVYQGSTNIYFTNTMTQVQMQAVLDSLHRNIVHDSDINIYFASGTYMITNPGLVVASMHGHDARINFIGNLTDPDYVVYASYLATNTTGSVGNFLSTNQSVIIDGTAVSGSFFNNVIACDGDNITFQFVNLRVKGNSPYPYTGVIGVHGGNGGATAEIDFCFIEGSSTNGAGIHFTACPRAEVFNTMISSNLYGIRAEWSSDVLSRWNKAQAGKLPQYGMISLDGSTISLRTTQQVVGVLGDMVLQWGGAFRTNAVIDNATNNVSKYLW